MSVSRRELFGLWRRPSPSPSPSPNPSPSPSPSPSPNPNPTFSLDEFYRDRQPSRGLPAFAVRAPVACDTSQVGRGPARADGVASVPAVAIAPDQVPIVLADACLATRSFCSVCCERCPRPGAIVVTAGRPAVVDDACDGCGRCIAACPAPVLAFALVARVSRRPEVP